MFRTLLFKTGLWLSILVLWAGEPSAQPLPERRFETIVNARNQIVERRQLDAAGVLKSRVRYAHDANGNLVQQDHDGELTIYHYDALDRLLEIHPPSGPPTVFRYGPGDLPIAQTRGGEETRFHYDGERLVLETNVIGNSVRHYTYAPMGLLVSGVLGGISEFRSAHLDGQFSPVVLTADNGNVVFRVRFDPYGVETTLFGLRDQRIGYHGYWTSPAMQAAGTLLSAARAYFPELGLFAERDPVEARPGDAAGQHAYLFARANPMRWSDPDGRAPISADLARALHDERAQAITRVNAAKMGLAEGPWYAMPGLLLLGATDFAYGMATSGTGAIVETGDLAADVAVAGLSHYIDLGDVGAHSGERVLDGIELGAQAAAGIADDPAAAMQRGVSAAVDPYAQALFGDDTAAQMDIAPSLLRSGSDAFQAMAPPGSPTPDYDGPMVITEYGLVPMDRMAQTALVPGSDAHKQQRWLDYQARKAGDPTGLGYHQWERRYEVAIRNSSGPLAREREFRQQTGGTNIVMPTPYGPRQIDSAVVNNKMLYQLKTGRESLSRKSSRLGTRSNEAAIQKDAWLVSQGYKVSWVLEAGATPQLLEALRNSGIKYHIGGLPVPAENK